MRFRLATSLALLAACGARSDERSYSLEELPVREWTLGLPVSGNGRLVVTSSLVAPSDWSVVKGHATFTCDGCTLGDDTTQMQLPLPPNTWIGNAIDFGHLTLDTVGARADFGDGRMHFESYWRSPELELDARVDGELHETAGETQVVGCVRFRPTEALERRDPKLYAIATTTGAPRDEAGWFFIQLEGSLRDLRRLGTRCQI